MQRYNPVSYTHLDVYKRQDRHRYTSLFALKTSMIAAILGSGTKVSQPHAPVFKSFPQTGHSPLPVSYTHLALDRLDQWNCDQPFCMMVGYISPHHPFDPPAPYSTMYDPNSLHLLPGYTDQPLPFDSNFGSSPIHPDKIDEKDIRAMMASYYGMISEIDNGIGTILQKLKACLLYTSICICNL